MGGGFVLLTLGETFCCGPGRGTVSRELTGKYAGRGDMLGDLYILVLVRRFISDLTFGV